jgi:hypothetical protein
VAFVFPDLTPAPATAEGRRPREPAHARLSVAATRIGDPNQTAIRGVREIRGLLFSAASAAGF